MTEMTLKQALIAVKKTIGTKKKWTRHAYARNADMKRTDPTDENAVCFCTGGAIKRVTDGKGYDLYEKIYRAIQLEMDGAIPAFNDTRSFEEVHERIDRAIAKA